MLEMCKRVCRLCILKCNNSGENSLGGRRKSMRIDLIRTISLNQTISTEKNALTVLAKMNWSLIAPSSQMQQNKSAHSNAQALFVIHIIIFGWDIPNISYYNPISPVTMRCGSLRSRRHGIFFGSASPKTSINAIAIDGFAALFDEQFKVVNFMFAPKSYLIYSAVGIRFRQTFTYTHRHCQTFKRSLVMIWCRGNRFGLFVFISSFSSSFAVYHFVLST